MSKDSERVPVRTDGSNQRYVEVPTLEAASIRLTLVGGDPGETSWAGEPRIRINLVRANGRPSRIKIARIHGIVDQSGVTGARPDIAVTSGSKLLLVVDLGET